MTERQTHTTEWVRAEDLVPGDIARMGSTWSFVMGTYSAADLAAADDEFGADTDTYHKIHSIVSTVAQPGDEVYVAVRYLYTNVTSGPGPEYRHKPHTPSYQVAAFSEYELVEIQKPSPKA